MEDERIIDLFFARSDEALEAVSRKYGKYCFYIAYRILRDDREAYDCVDETYLSAWRTIPPERPAVLSHFLGRITRNAAINRYDYNSAKKRSGIALAIDEFYECIPDGKTPIDEEIALKNSINAFLASLQKKERIIFMQRYWYAETVKEIADAMTMTESAVKVSLFRTRMKFKEHLVKDGIFIVSDQ